MNLQNTLSDELWNVVQSHFQNGDYTGSIRDAFIYLSNIVREKSDLSGDGTDLINKAFSENAPKIKINRLETTSDIDEQKGIANILKGCYQYIRNPRSHEKFEDNENDCVSILCFIDFVVAKLKVSTGQFELSFFINQVIDKRFVRTKSYCDELIKEIPERKLFDTFLEVYKNRNLIDIYNFELLASCFYERFNDTKMDIFIKMISDELRTTLNDSDIRIIVKILNSDLWIRVNQIARIRTENRIIDSIKETSFLGTWCIHIFQSFIDKEGLYNAFLQLLVSDKEKKEYFYKYYFQEAIRIISKDMLYENGNELDIFSIKPFYIYKMRENINSGQLIDYNYIKNILVMLPDYMQKYFSNAIENFKEVITENTDVPPDNPF